MNEGQKQLDWRLGVSPGVERPRFIILAFQTSKSNDQTKNTSIFNHCNVTNVSVRLNGKKYPKINFQLNFKKNRYITSYKIP